MGKQTIGSMVAVVSATADQFGTDIKKIEGHIDHLNNHADQGGGIGSSILGGAAAGAGFAAAQLGINSLTGAVSKLFDSIARAAELNDFAQQIGATAEEIKGLQYAASQSGSSAEAMDSALQKMVQKIGEARQSAEGTVPAFEKLGLSTTELSKMSAGDALKVISDRFKNIKNPADQAAIAVDLFGKQGVNLVNTLNRGSEGIDELIAGGKELGAVMSDEEVAAASAAHDAIVKLSAAWDGLWNRLVVLVLPTLEVLIGTLTGLIGVANRAFSAFFEFVGFSSQASNKAKASIENAGIVDAVEKTTEAADDGAKALEDMMRRGAQIAQQTRTPFEQFNDTINDLAQLLSVGAIGWTTYERAVNQANDALERATEEKEKADSFNPAQGVGAAIRGTSEGVSAVQTGLRQQVDAARRQEELSKQQLTEDRKHTESLRRITDALNRGNAVIRGVDL